MRKRAVIALHNGDLLMFSFSSMEYGIGYVSDHCVIFQDVTSVIADPYYGLLIPLDQIKSLCIGC